MGRSPWGVAGSWIAVAVLALVGGAVLFWRLQHPAGVAGQSADTIIRNAWGPGRKVALSGTQSLEMPGRDGKPLNVKARVLSAADGSIRIEYLSPPLKGATVWETGDHTWRFNPNRHRLTSALRRMAPDEDGHQVTQLLENYQPRVLRTDTVAGRPAWEVELRPRHESNRWRLLWIDQETWVTLKTVEHKQSNGRDEVLRSTAFDEVRYLDAAHQPSAAEFRPPDALVQKYGVALKGDTSSRFQPAALSRLVGFPVRMPKWLPRGYVFQGAYQTPCTCNREHQAVRLEWSDGLNRITLLECGHPGHDPNANCYSGTRPASMVLARMVKIAGTDWYFLAVGDVPELDLSKIVNSAA